MTRLRTGLITATVAVAAAAVTTACSSSSGGGGGGGGSSSKITFAYSNAIMQVEKVPIHQTLTTLKKDGMKTKESYFQSGDDVIPAVSRGDADFGTANASTVFAAIKKGAPIQGVMTSVNPAYLLVAPSSVADPGGLDGKRVGIQSKISSTTLYTQLALSKYPSAKPKLLVVPGSASRVQAMIAGQLDASVVQFADWLTLQAKAPGKFHVIYDVAKQNPDIIDSVIFTSTRTIKTRADYVKKVVSALRKQYAALYKEPDALAKEIAAIVPKTTAANAQKLATETTQDRIWPPDGGFGTNRIDATLAALKSAGLLDSSTLPTRSACCTSEFLK